MTPVVRAIKLTVGGPVGVFTFSFATRIFTAVGSFDAEVLNSEPGKYVTQYVPHYAANLQQKL